MELDIHFDCEKVSSKALQVPVKLYYIYTSFANIWVMLKVLGEFTITYAPCLITELDSFGGYQCVWLHLRLTINYCTTETVD